MFCSTEAIGASNPYPENNPSNFSVGRDFAIAAMSKNTRPKKDLAGMVTTDSRFSIIHTDPRFSRPKKKDVKIPLDLRFKAAFRDKEFIDQRIAYSDIVKA